MSEKQLEALQKKRDQINARIKKIKSKEGAAKRKADTSAKVLLGAAILTRLDKGDSESKDILQWCKSALTEKDKTRLDAVLEARK